MNTREDKIKFLTELSQGKRSMMEIMEPVKLYLIQEDSTGDNFKCFETGRKYTRTEIESMQLAKSSSVWVSPNGYENKGGFKHLNGCGPVTCIAPNTACLDNLRTLYLNQGRPGNPNNVKSLIE